MVRLTKRTKIGWQNLVLRSFLMSSLALFNCSGSVAAVHWLVAAELKLRFTNVAWLLFWNQGLEETQIEKKENCEGYLREKRRRDERSGEGERWRGEREFGSGGGEAEETRSGDLSSKRGSHGVVVECERQALCHMKRFGGVLIRCLGLKCERLNATLQGEIEKYDSRVFEVCFFLFFLSLRIYQRTKWHVVTYTNHNVCSFWSVNNWLLLIG